MRRMRNRPRNYEHEFMLAIYQGDSYTVGELLDEFPSLVNVNAENLGISPLSHAIDNGQTDIVKLLIERGASVDLKPMNEDLGSLIHTAVKRGGNETEEICKILVEAGVDVNKTNIVGLTPVHVAINHRREDVARVLLKLGADVNAKLEDGMLLIHYAADSGAGRFCELLVDGGADVNAKDDDGLTPLHKAARRGYLDVMEILLDLGADIDASDMNGNTALHLASKFRQARAVVTLIENGANVNIVNKKGQTAFQFVASKMWTICQLDILKMQIAMNEGNLEDLGITTDINEQVQLMRKYEEEVQRIRSLEINGTNLIFHDILTNSVDQMVLYARNAYVAQALRLKDYQREFPEYADLIEGRFNKGLERKELLDEGHRFFLGRLSKHKDLPYKCTDKILSYLSNRDLTNLNFACSY